MITAAVTAAGLAAASLGAGLSGTPASTGTGIGAGNICLASPAQPGGTYQAGDVYVTDTGSTAESAGVTTAPLWPGQQVYKDELAISPSWVNFTPPAVALGPGQGASIPVTLTIPAGARHGIYVANILAGPQGSPAWSGTGEHAQLAGFAQTFLIFSIGKPAPSCTLPPAPGSPWAAQYAPLQPQDATVSMTWLRQHLPWVFGGKQTTAAQAASTPVADTAGTASPAGKAAGGLTVAALIVAAVTALAVRRRRA
jgi:hypothetical protein